VANESLPRYNRKTTLRVKLTDRAANIGIRVGGLGVIAAVLGLIAFIGLQVIPLFADADTGLATEPFSLHSARTLVLHTDEYRRAAVRITDDGVITTISVPTGEVIQSFKPEQLGGAKLKSAYITLNPRTRRQIRHHMDVPHYHILFAGSQPISRFALETSSMHV
jgi:hypothetical protein